MAALHLNPVEFAREEPVKFRVLQALCARCETPEQCARDLADGSADPGWQDWRDYCRNATMLSALSAPGMERGRQQHGYASGHFPGKGEEAGSAFLTRGCC